MLNYQKTEAVLRKINYRLERLIPLTTPLSIVFGFLLPFVFIHLRPFVPWIFTVITLSGALKLRVAELGATIRNPLPILLCFVAAHVLMPVLAMFTSTLLIDNPDVVSGFVLVFSGPPAVSAFIWVLILRGDLALCLTIMLLNTLLAPIVVPASLSILMGSKVALDMSGIAISLLIMIVIPTIIGIGINEASKKKIPNLVCPWLDPLSKICLMTVIATNAAIISPGIKFADPLIWKVAALVIVLIFTGFFLIKLVAVIGKCPAPKDIAMIIPGGLRNNSVVMTIAVASFPEATVIPALLSIIFQQSIAGIIGKLFTKKSVNTVKSP